MCNHVMTLEFEILTLCTVCLLCQLCKRHVQSVSFLSAGSLCLL